MFDIKEELKKLPDTPGVYIMHSADDAIIYVGKAINLKRRVSSYFQTRPRSPKIEKMISLIDHFEFIVVKSELEALALECNLIKENRPKYNTMLMDDKTYPFVKVTVDELYPRVFLTRRHLRDKAKYFGPYTNVTAVKDILKMFGTLYRFRTCEKKLDGSASDRPCLYYQLGQCMGPCSGQVSQEEYRNGINEIVRFFEGDSSFVKRLLTQRMKEHSEKMEFEKAAEYRDMLRGIDQLSQVQRVTAADESNRDCIGVAMKDYKAIVQVFFIRGGKMVGREHYYVTAESEDKKQVLTEFVKQFYGGAAVIPREILVSENIEDAALISDWLSERAGAKVKITTPQKGKKEKLVELAVTNAGMVLKNDLEKLSNEAARTTGAIEELGRLLDIEPPKRIESYDISNISGFESVGSMVVYEDGKPKRSDYRRFRIKSVQGPDDYASMQEVLSRRFEHYLKTAGLMPEESSETAGLAGEGLSGAAGLAGEGQSGAACFDVEEQGGAAGLAGEGQSGAAGLAGEGQSGAAGLAGEGQSGAAGFDVEEQGGAADFGEMNDASEEPAEEDGKIKDSFEKLPDLILMDGGRGQVNICLDVLAKYNLKLMVCGMVKDDHHRTRGIYFNNVELPIDTGSEMFKLVTRIQDETHRFAIEYHKSLRSKTQVKSILDDIPGIGTARRRALIKHYESLEDIRNATVEELASVENMNRPSAESVYEFFHKKS